MAEMEAAEYDEKRVNIVKQVQVVDLAINDYTDEDVEPYDVVDGEHLRQLQRIHDKYDLAQGDIRLVLAELKDSEVDKKRKQDLAYMQTGLSKRMEDNEKKVEKAAAKFELMVPTEKDVQRRIIQEKIQKQDRADKVIVL